MVILYMIIVVVSCPVGSPNPLQHINYRSRPPDKLDNQERVGAWWSLVVLTTSLLSPSPCLVSSLTLSVKLTRKKGAGLIILGLPHLSSPQLSLSHYINCHHYDGPEYFMFCLVIFRLKHQYSTSTHLEYYYYATLNIWNILVSRLSTTVNRKSRKELPQTPILLDICHKWKKIFIMYQHLNTNRIINVFSSIIYNLKDIIEYYSCRTQKISDKKYCSALQPVKGWWWLMH